MLNSSLEELFFPTDTIYEGCLEEKPEDWKLYTYNNANWYRRGGHTLQLPTRLEGSRVIPWMLEKRIRDKVTNLSTVNPKKFRNHKRIDLVFQARFWKGQPLAHYERDDFEIFLKIGEEKHRIEYNIGGYMAGLDECFDPLISMDAIYKVLDNVGGSAFQVDTPSNEWMA